MSKDPKKAKAVPKATKAAANKTKGNPAGGKAGKATAKPAKVPSAKAKVKVTKGKPKPSAAKPGKGAKGGKAAATVEEALEVVRKPKKVKPGSALVVVESPAKARTIGKYLGSGYVVKASVGHIRDLRKKDGVDVENNFEPFYEVIEGKKKVVAEIRKAARENEIVYLASDPDREGEAIAWHLAEEIKDINTNLKRVLINEITKKGVTAAIAAPREIDMDKTDAQQARRILDRLVGFEISPILWNKVQRGLSAGRVQSVAVRLVCEREEEIKAFKPEEYWSVDVTCRAAQPPPFEARIWRWRGEKAEPKTADDANAIAAELAAGTATVATVDKKERRKKAQAPFITSRLQQDAARKLRYSAKRTMALAQRLYEGVELGAEGPTGLITYMRTDSTRISDDAMTALRQHITEAYGADYLPETPNIYGNKARAQDAHEAIRPTQMEWTPEKVAVALAEHPEANELVKLYTLIWQRFVASQMVPAVYDATTIDMERGAAVLRSTGQVLKFAGYTKVYEVAETDDAKAEAADSADRLLPPVEVGDTITLESVRPEQHFTQPPPRFSEASLVKELEEKGIGRPSTYAAIMSTIVDRGYVEKKEARFWPTELGILVNGLLVVSFPEIVSSDFTAKMESDLDKVEDGEVNWRKLLGEFYAPFKVELETARTEMRDVKREEIATDWVCDKPAAVAKEPAEIEAAAASAKAAKKAARAAKKAATVAETGTPEAAAKAAAAAELAATEAAAAAALVPTTAPAVATDEHGDVILCGKPMVIKWGRNGSFLACQGYPECRNTMEVVKNLDGTWEKVPPQTTDEVCETCAAPMTIKRGRFGSFLACTRYPDCKTTKPISLGVKCPRPGCGGFLAEKRSRRGKPFYGCSNWAKKQCDFVAWDRPIPQPCPTCSAKFVVKKETKRGITLRCMECDWRQGVDDAEEGSADATPDATPGATPGTTTAA